MGGRLAIERQAGPWGDAAPRIQNAPNEERAVVASTNAAGCGTRPLQTFDSRRRRSSSIIFNVEAASPGTGGSAALGLLSPTRDDPVEQTETPEPRGRPPRRPPTARAKWGAARAHPPHERGRSLGDARRAEAVAGRVRLAREPDTPCVAPRARHRGKRLARA